MLNSLKKCGKVIVKELAIAFFFTSLVVLIVNFTLNNYVSPYIKLFNKIAVSATSSTTKRASDIKIDSETNKLTNVPAYGEAFGTLKISSLDVETTLYNGDSLTILKKGVGRYIGSFYPGEGKPIIIAGHNSKRDFYYLHTMKEKDTIEIDTYYGVYTYEVTKAVIVKATDLDAEFNTFLDNDSEETLLLYTCYPSTGVGYRYQRFVVYAKKVKGSSL